MLYIILTSTLTHFGYAIREGAAQQRLSLLPYVGGLQSSVCTIPSLSGDVLDTVFHLARQCDLVLCRLGKAIQHLALIKPFAIQLACPEIQP